MGALPPILGHQANKDDKQLHGHDPLLDQVNQGEKDLDGIIWQVGPELCDPKINPKPSARLGRTKNVAQMPKWELGELKLRVIARSLQEDPSFEHVPLKEVAVDLPLANGPSINSADHSLSKTGPMRLESLLLRVLEGDVSILLESLQQSTPNRGSPNNEDSRKVL